MLQEKRREATMRVIGDKIRTFTRVEKPSIQASYYLD